MRFNINVALLAATAVNAVSIQQAEWEEYEKVAAIFSDTMLDYGDHNDDGYTGVGLDLEEHVLVSIGGDRIDMAMAADDERTDALVSVLEEYGFDD